LDIVTETRQKLENEGAVQQTWIKENAKAVYHFCLGGSKSDAEPDCIHHHQGYVEQTALYEQRSESSKLILTQRFHEYHMDSGDSIVAHAAKVQNLARQLVDIGEQVSDVAILGKIIATLSSKHNAFKMRGTACQAIDKP